MSITPPSFFSSAPPICHSASDRSSNQAGTEFQPERPLPDPAAAGEIRQEWPRVSVIIPIYNGEADLSDLVAGLNAQTYPIDRVEYLLVDNNSHDRTAQLLMEFAVSSCDPTTSHPPLRPLQERQVQSSYAARNTGIKAATGEVLVFTDADCRPHPQWLTELVKPFGEERVGLVAGNIQALPSHSWLERYAERHEVLSQKHTLAHPFCAYGQTANLAIRRRALEQTGLFRPHLDTGGDADLCWRILQTGDWQIDFAEAALIYHRHRTTLAELRSQWRRYGRSNRYLHDLHGVELAREMSLSEYGRRIGRWLLKELPIALGQAMKQNHSPSSQSSSPFAPSSPSLPLWVRWLDLSLDTPLDLICRQARAAGQRQAHLSDAAHDIEWFE